MSYGSRDMGGSSSIQNPQSRGGQKGGEASLHSEKVSAAQLQMYLKGMDYPAGKQEIIQQARTNSAPENIMSFLNRLPDKTYNRPTDVEQEFTRIK